MADQGKKVVGKLYVRVGGEMLPLVGDGPVTLYGLAEVERETKMGPDGPIGYVEKAVPPRIEATVQLGPGLAPEDIKTITDATVTAETDTGKTYTLVNAWGEKADELGSNGEFKVAFGGMQWKDSSAQADAGAGGA